MIQLMYKFMETNLYQNGQKFPSHSVSALTPHPQDNQFSDFFSPKYISLPNIELYINGITMYTLLYKTSFTQHDFETSLSISVVQPFYC